MNTVSLSKKQAYGYGIDGAKHQRWLEGVRAVSLVLTRFTVRAIQN